VLRRCIAIALVLVVAVVLGGWCVTLLLTQPNRRTIGEPPADLHARAITFRSESGAALRGWYVEGVRGHGAVVLMHGVHADRRAMIGRARLLAQAGYAVLLFDFQAHGESEGEAITFGWRERLDAQAALAWMREAAPGERIGVIAASMGGAAVLLAQPVPSIEALVLEQVYPTVDEALDNRLRNYLGPLGPLLSPVLEREVSWHVGLAPSLLRPVDHIASVDAPVLILAGEVDRHTTLAQSRALFAAAREPKLLWIVPGAAHVDLCAYAGAEYPRHVLPFLASHLRAD
jgi:fermentation-respiration switch protein FrsA (DUF1100 family)